jgi:hypothetical protein
MGLGELVSFGFDSSAASSALDAAGGDFQAALNALCLGGDE